MPHNALLALSSAILACLMLHGGVVQAQAPVAGSEGAAARCGELRKLTLSGLRIDDVRLVPAGPVSVPSAADPVDLPAHCLFQGTFEPRTGPQGQQFGVGFELRLPLSWQGKLVFQGGGGLDGVLAPSYGTAGGARAPGLGSGFGVVSTGGGRRRGSMGGGHVA